MPQADPDIIRSAIEFWQKAYSAHEATVKFTKKDGTIRIMTFTLDFAKIPKKKQPKSVNIPKILKLIQNSGIMHVFDLDKQEWRSVPFNNVDWLRVGKEQYKIRPYKR
jgi:hypothetical protein